MYLDGGIPCNKVKYAPYVMSIALHDTTGVINSQQIQINIKKFQDTVRCFGFRDYPDLAIIKVANPGKKKVYSIEQFITFDVPKDFDSLKIIGFPTTAERESLTVKHKLLPASVLNISNYSMFHNYGYSTDHGIMVDTINYAIQPKDVIIDHGLKGYSGVPAFIKDKNLNQYFSQVFL